MTTPATRPAPGSPLVRVEDGVISTILCHPCADRRGYPLDAREPWTADAWAMTVDADPDTGTTAAPEACQDCGAAAEWSIP